MKIKTLHAITNSRDVQQELDKTNVIRQYVYDVLSGDTQKNMTYDNKSLIARAVATKLALARDSKKLRIVVLIGLMTIVWLVSLAYTMYGVSMLNFFAACVASAAVFFLVGMYSYRTVQSIADAQLLAVETMSIMAVTNYISEKYGSDEMGELARNVLGASNES